MKVKTKIRLLYSIPLVLIMPLLKYITNLVFNVQAYDAVSKGWGQGNW